MSEWWPVVLDRMRARLRLEPHAVAGLREMGVALDAIEFDWPGVLVEHGPWNGELPRPGVDLVAIGPKYKVHEVLSVRPGRMRVRPL